MDTSTMFDGFESFDHARYADEAERRWGDTDAYRESMRRMKQYSKEELARIQQEGEGIVAAMARALAAGRSPQDDEVLELAERHRHHIGHFYPCPPAMHVGLADMYEADPRFGEYFEKRGEGLTAFVAEAIRANADRLAADDSASEDR